jgi:hypothetical protein
MDDYWNGNDKIYYQTNLSMFTLTGRFTKQEGERLKTLLNSNDPDFIKLAVMAIDEMVAKTI